jgi:ABC-type multidrug transport system ATPase subunit
MQDFASAIIGSDGNGLSRGQRKLVSIGVELAAKPQCLLFLDEPTSGLDSESSLAIVASLQRLAKSGMAILATIHQPSSVLIQKFDRLLFLTKGGKAVYFGDIGPKGKSVIGYFEGYGARKCDDSENPAEYLLEVLTPTRDSDELDWARIWRSSEKKRLQDDQMACKIREMSNTITTSPTDNHLGDFEAPMYSQILQTSIRAFQQQWRMPSYVWGKLLLGLTSSL